jgi:hypothetical protein
LGSNGKITGLAAVQSFARKGHKGRLVTAAAPAQNPKKPAKVGFAMAKKYLEKILWLKSYSQCRTNKPKTAPSSSTVLGTSNWSWRWLATS